jgi:hypothetical protein
MSQLAPELQSLGETIRRGIATAVNHTLSVAAKAGKCMPADEVIVWMTRELPGFGATPEQLIADGKAASVIEYLHVEHLHAAEDVRQ